MIEFLIKTSQFFLSLSILIVLHELGHFIPAKLFKTKVEKFYLFFDPYFSIFKKKIGSTEYGIGWIPLGGYVKIAGMIDESMDKKQLEKPIQPWEFRSKPAWQRLIIMIGGVTVNVIVAIIIYSMILFYWGQQYLEVKNMKYGIECSQFAKDLGFKNGDKILSVDGKYYENFSDLPEAILLSGEIQVKVERNDQVKFIVIPDNIIEKLIKNKDESGFISPAWPYIASKFDEGSPAFDAGVRVGDQLIGLNGKSLYYFTEYLNELKDLRSDEISLMVLREKDTLNFNFHLNSNSKMGIYYTSPSELLKYSKKTFSFFGSFPAGAKMARNRLNSYMKQFKLILNPNTGAWKGLGGFITMGKQFKSEWDWYHFWNFTAFLSIILAFMNILPIPALDGGHVMFLLGEIITGKKPSDKLLERAQVFGFLILMFLLVIANGNDIIRLFN